MALSILCNDCGILIKAKAWKIALLILCNDCGIQYGGFLIIKNRFSVWPSYTTPGYLPKGFKVNTSKTLAHRCLFLTTQLWNQPTYPTAEEWGRKMWFLYTVELSRHKESSHVVERKWKQLKTIILSDLSRFQKEKCQIFSLVCSSCILYRYTEIMMTIWQEREGKRENGGKGD